MYIKDGHGDFMKLAFYDSGVGGLSVLLPLIKEYRNLDFIYLGDNKYFPYGEKSLSFLRHRAKEVAEFFNKEKADLLIVACNTISASALDVLKKNFKGDVYGIIDCGVLGALRQTKNNKIGLIATNRTIDEGVYQKMIHESGDYQIFEKPCPKIIELIENGQLRTSKMRDCITYDIGKFKDLDIDTLILGCTHFPLVKGEIQEEIPKIQLIDPADCLIEKLKEVLEDAGSGSLDIRYTKEEKEFVHLINSKISRDLSLNKVTIG